MRIKNGNIPMLRGYPLELSLDESDNFPNWKGFDSSSKALKYAIKTGGQFYSQVDCDCDDYEKAREENRDLAYLKGNHVCNRTGWFIVVKR